MPMMSLMFFWMFDFSATRASCSVMVVTSSMERIASRHLVVEVLVDLHLHLHVVHGALAGDDQPVVRLHLRRHEQHRLHLAGEDVHAADDEHVVGPARDPVHAGVGPAADARLGVEAGDVAGAVADEREGFLGEGGDDQFAHLALGQHLARSPGR